ncbi:MAG: methyltransferase, TrmH family, group 3 [Firmicutes bacterium]|nr:methyltransferase, TrmH family, group 3 [Bacillota bacterium]
MNHKDTIPLSRYTKEVTDLHPFVSFLRLVGADMDGEKNYYEADLTGPIVVVVGNEGKGMGRLTKEHCDFVVRIPMLGKISSLNASVACSLLLYEVVRQREMKNK